MTLPVSKAVADASLDAAILVCIARYPGSRRCDVEDDRTVAAILARAESAKQARTWLVRAFERLHERGAIEKRRRQVGWFVVQQEAVAS